MSQPVPTVGTRDFYQDAANMLHESDTPHIMLCGFTGSKWRYRSCNINTVQGVAWFRAAVNQLLDEVEERIRRDGK